MKPSNLNHDRYHKEGALLSGLQSLHVTVVEIQRAMGDLHDSEIARDLHIEDPSGEGVRHVLATRVAVHEAMDQLDATLEKLFSKSQLPENGQQVDPSLAAVIEFPQGKVIANDILRGLAEQLSPPEFLKALEDMIRKGFGDRCKEVIDFIEIMANETAFREDNTEQIAILEQAAAEYGFGYWLEQQGKEAKEATREDFISWWDFFMTMAGERGYTPSGHINTVGQTTNLWRATGSLAKKMTENASVYMHLPALLINNAEQVARTLDQIEDPRAFAEVLTGEAWEDMAKSPAFLSAFATTAQEGAEGAVGTIKLALQRRGA